MMKTVRKIFMAWEFEEEERWLNQMSADGWHLVKSNGVTHHFEQGEPGAYHYKVQMVEKDESYLNFLEEMGIEHVGTCFNGMWIYLRKAGGESFEIFSDRESKVKHLQKIHQLMKIIIVILTVCMLMEVLMAHGGGSTAFTVCYLLIVLPMNLWFSHGMGEISEKIRHLQREAELYQ